MSGHTIQSENSNVEPTPSLTSGQSEGQKANNLRHVKSDSIRHYRHFAPFMSFGNSLTVDYTRTAKRCSSIRRFLSL